MTAADHTPSPTTDGLREAIEALVGAPNPRAAVAGSPYSAGRWDAFAEVRAVLAAHPAPPSEAVQVLRGWRTHPDGSRSPIERWVRAADGDWISLDSTRRTSGDILIDFEETHDA